MASAPTRIAPARRRVGSPRLVAAGVDDLQTVLERAQAGAVEGTIGAHRLTAYGGGDRQREVAQDRGGEVDRSDQPPLVGGGGGERASPAQPRERAPQQFIALPVGGPLHDDQQLVGRATGGEQAQLSLPGRVGGQIGDEQRVAFAQLGDARGQIGGGSERDRGDVAGAVGCHHAVRVVLARDADVGAATGDRGGEQPRLEDLGCPVGAPERPRPVGEQSATRDFAHQPPTGAWRLGGRLRAGGHDRQYGRQRR
jgi:hypothetical protein